MNNFKKTVYAALFAALIFVSTSIIKIPSPTTGYIHPGDGFVLLAGIFLGPLWGGLAAGFGSMLSDIAGGYVSYAIATFIIKFLAAAICSILVKQLTKLFHEKKETLRLIISGVVAELVMVLGYFIFEIFLLGLSANSKTFTDYVRNGIVAAASGIPFNLIQGAFGVIILVVLYHAVIKRIKLPQ